MKKYPNLIPNSERTPEQLREMGRKGGIASGIARRKRREIRKNCQMWLTVLTEMEKENASEKIFKKIYRP